MSNLDFLFMSVIDICTGLTLCDLLLRYKEQTLLVVVSDKLTESPLIKVSLALRILN